jgi:hypothetical protein
VCELQAEEGTQYVPHSLTGDSIKKPTANFQGVGKPLAIGQAAA